MITTSKIAPFVVHTWANKYLANIGNFHRVDSNELKILHACSVLLFTAAEVTIAATAGGKRQVRDSEGRHQINLCVQEQGNMYHMVIYHIYICVCTIYKWVYVTIFNLTPNSN